MEKDGERWKKMKRRKKGRWGERRSKSVKVKESESETEREREKERVRGRELERKENGRKTE